jgi:hypothetical protein
MRLAHCIVPSVLMLAAGCNGQSALPSLAPSPHESRVRIGGSPVSAPGGTPADAGISIVQLAFDVLRVDLPLAGSRDVLSIWNHIDRLRVSPEVTARLARNGIRIGAVPPSAWPAIETILDSPQTELRKETLLAQGGEPLAIKMASVGEGESIFMYGAQNRIAGKTFASGDKLITLDYGVSMEARGEMPIQVGFEIRDDLGVMTWKRESGVVREVPAYDRHVFEELATTIRLTDGEAVAIGLGPDADNDYLIGNRFLTIERNAKRFETVLFITPRPRGGARDHSSGN